MSFLVLVCRGHGCPHRELVFYTRDNFCTKFHPRELQTTYKAKLLRGRGSSSPTAPRRAACCQDSPGSQRAPSQEPHTQVRASPTGTGPPLFSRPEMGVKTTGGAQVGELRQLG